MDYLGGPDVITKVLTYERGRQKRRSECCNVRKTQLTMADFKDGGRDPCAK